MIDQVPEQQGLKPPLKPLGFERRRMIDQVPEQQGLKQQVKGSPE